MKRLTLLCGSFLLLEIFIYMNLKKIIREEVESSKGVTSVHVVYFPTINLVLDKTAWYWDGEFDLNGINFSNVITIIKNGFDENPDSLLASVREYIEEELLEDDHEYYMELLNTMTIRSFVITVEEVKRADTSFFDNL